MQLERTGRRAAPIQHVFELVLRLKQICNFDPATGDSTKLERLEADLEEVAASGKKAIVFSQWVEHARADLAERLERFGPLEYHGKIPRKQRDASHRAVQATTRRSTCILMSYGAGSVGLNLQFCRLRVPVRPLVEPGRRRPGDQPGPPHRRRRAGHRHAVPDARTRSKSGSTRCSNRSGELFDTIFAADRRPAQARPDAARNLRPVQAPHARRPAEERGVMAASGPAS